MSITLALRAIGGTVRIVNDGPNSWPVVQPHPDWHPGHNRLYEAPQEVPDYCLASAMRLAADSTPGHAVAVFIADEVLRRWGPGSAVGKVKGWAEHAVTTAQQYLAATERASRAANRQSQAIS